MLPSPLKLALSVLPLYTLCLPSFELLASYSYSCQLHSTYFSKITSTSPNSHSLTLQPLYPKDIEKGTLFQGTCCLLKALKRSDEQLGSQGNEALLQFSKLFKKLQTDSKVNDDERTYSYQFKTYRLTRTAYDRKKEQAEERWFTLVTLATDLAHDFSIQLYSSKNLIDNKLSDRDKYPIYLRYGPYDFSAVQGVGGYSFDNTLLVLYPLQNRKLQTFSSIWLDFDADHEPTDTAKSISSFQLKDGLALKASLTQRLERMGEHSNHNDPAWAYWREAYAIDLLEKMKFKSLDQLELFERMIFFEKSYALQVCKAVLNYFLRGSGFTEELLKRKGSFPYAPLFLHYVGACTEKAALLQKKTYYYTYKGLAELLTYEEDPEEGFSKQLIARSRSIPPQQIVPPKKPTPPLASAPYAVAFENATPFDAELVEEDSGVDVWGVDRFNFDWSVKKSFYRIRKEKQELSSVHFPTFMRWIKKGNCLVRRLVLLDWSVASSSFILSVLTFLFFPEQQQLRYCDIQVRKEFTPIVYGSLSTPFVHFSQRASVLRENLLLFKKGYLFSDTDKLFNEKFFNRIRASVPHWLYSSLGLLLSHPLSTQLLRMKFFSLTTLRKEKMQLAFFGTQSLLELLSFKLDKKNEQYIICIGEKASRYGLPCMEKVDSLFYLKQVEGVYDKERVPSLTSNRLPEKCSQNFTEPLLFNCWVDLIEGRSRMELSAFTQDLTFVQHRRCSPPEPTYVRPYLASPAPLKTCLSRKAIRDFSSPQHTEENNQIDGNVGLIMPKTERVDITLLL